MWKGKKGNLSTVPGSGNKCNALFADLRNPFNIGLKIFRFMVPATLNFKQY